MDPRIADVIKSVADAAIKLADTKGVEVPTLQTIRSDIARRDTAIRSALNLDVTAPIDASVLSRVSALRPAAPVARPLPQSAALFPELGGVPLTERRNTRSAALDLDAVAPIGMMALSSGSAVRPAVSAARSVANLSSELGRAPFVARQNTRRSTTLSRIPEETTGNANGAGDVPAGAGAGAEQQGGRRRARRHHQKTQKRRRVQFRKV